MAIDRNINRTVMLYSQRISCDIICIARWKFNALLFILYYTENTEVKAIAAFILEVDFYKWILIQSIIQVNFDEHIVYTEIAYVIYVR